MEVRILGPLETVDSGGHLQPGPMERVVLARLAVAQGRAVSDDALMDLLWGDDLPVSARKGLNGYVYRLPIRVLGDDKIVRTIGATPFATRWPSTSAWSSVLPRPLGWR